MPGADIKGGSNGASELPYLGSAPSLKVHQKKKTEKKDRIRLEKKDKKVVGNSHRGAYLKLLSYLTVNLPAVYGIRNIAIRLGASSKR